MKYLHGRVLKVREGCKECVIRPTLVARSGASTRLIFDWNITER